MRIIGVDPSTKSGIVILDEGGTPIPKLLQFKDLRGFNRLKALSQSFDNLLRDHHPDLVVIEGYAYGNRYTLASLVEIGTLFRYAARNMGLPVLEVTPNTLKKFATGSGSATKDKIALEVERRWGFTSKYDDVVDAYVLAKLGQSLDLKAQLPKGVSFYE